MKIIIEGSAKEITALVVELQERQEEFVPTDSSGKLYDNMQNGQPVDCTDLIVGKPMQRRSNMSIRSLERKISALEKSIQKRKYTEKDELKLSELTARLISCINLIHQ